MARFAGRPQSTNIEPPGYNDNGDFWEQVLRSGMHWKDGIIPAIGTALFPSDADRAFRAQLDAEIAKAKLAGDAPRNTAAMRSAAATGLVPGPLWGDTTLIKDPETGKFVEGIDSPWLRDSLASDGALAQPLMPAFRQHLSTGSTSSNIEDRAGIPFTGPKTPLHGAMMASSGGIDKRVLKTIIAEAGGDPKAMQAVAAVIFNRAAATGKTPLQVVKAPGQFEGYSSPGPSIAKQLNDPKLLSRAEAAYTGISNGTVADPTNGGTMYHADYVSPYWASSANKNGSVNIGGNVFYKGNSASRAIDAAMAAPSPMQRPADTVADLSYGPHHGPRTEAERTYDKVYRDGLSSLTAPAVPSAQHSAPIFDLPTLPPPPMATLDQAPMPPMPRPRPNPHANLTAMSVNPNGTPVAPPAPIAPSGLTTRKVNTVAIDPMTGNPVGSQPDLQTALNAKAAQMRLAARGTTPTTTFQAGVTQLPRTVVPASVQRAYDQIATTGRNASGSPDDRGSVPVPKPIMPSYPTPTQMAAINDTHWFPPETHHAIATQEQQPETSPNLAYNGDQGTTPATQAIATAAPYAPAYNAGTWGSAPLFPALPRPPAAMPLTTFDTVDPGSQMLPQVEAGFNTTGLGHIVQAVRGEPIQGGLLGLLLNGRGGQGGGTHRAPSPQVSRPGEGFLREQGQDTSHMTAGQLANALNKSIF